MIRITAVRRITVVVMLACITAAVILISGCGTATVVLATTSDIAQSALYGTMVKEFESVNGVTVKTETYDNSVEVMKAGAQGQADALLVSNKMALDEWMKDGNALSANDVFYNDFIVVGPDSDPAQIRGLDCPGKSCKKIGTAGLPFVARGDGSDLDAKVMGYWDKCGVNPAGQAWFTKTEEGMVVTLTEAGDSQAYTVCDMSTWLENKDSIPLAKLVEGCSMLMNQYSLVVINPDNFPGNKLNKVGAEKLAEFMTGEAGQSIIGAYQESGVVIYHPNATRQSDEKQV
jgi:tungstate transport system substrate-binding protein